MAHVLTWQTLGKEDAKRCLNLEDIDDVRAVLHDIKSHNPAGSFPYSTQLHNKGQARILVDLYAHAILFARSLDMSSVKLSSLVGILHQVHETSMAERRTRAASYDLLRALIVQHSVARPPYSAAIFSLEDVRALDEYILATYYRHYKMYYFAFVPKLTATLRVVPLGALTEVPPVDLPPLSAAVPEDEWRRRVEAREQAVEMEKMEAVLHESEAMEEERLRRADINDPTYTEGIREQLEAIRNAVLLKSTDRLGVLEEKLAAIEAKVDENFATKARSPSKSATRKK